MIVLRYLLEYSPGEIARALDLPRGTVNSRLRRGPRRARDPAQRDGRGERRRADSGCASSARPTRSAPSAALGTSSAPPTSSVNDTVLGGRAGASSVAPALALIVAALVLSPAGATVRRLITQALGERHAAPALFSLPSPGRLLVSGPGGTWTAAADGSTRRLGPWCAGELVAARAVRGGRLGRRAGGRRPARQCALAAGAAGGQRPSVVLAERLPGCVPVGGHASCHRRRRDRRSPAGHGTWRTSLPRGGRGSPTARSSSRTSRRVAAWCCAIATPGASCGRRRRVRGRAS